MKIRILNSAKADMREIQRYITARDSKEAANKVIFEIQKLVNGLKELPDRGSPVRELEAVAFRITGSFFINLTALFTQSKMITFI